MRILGFAPLPLVRWQRISLDRKTMSEETQDAVDTTETPSCSYCGTEIRRDLGSFCVECGFPLPELPGMDPAEEIENLVQPVLDHFVRYPHKSHAILWTGVYTAAFGIMTLLLLAFPGTAGPDQFGGMAWLNTANLIFLTVAGPLFGFLVLFAWGFDP